MVKNAVINLPSRLRGRCLSMGWASNVGAISHPRAHTKSVHRVVTAYFQRHGHTVNLADVRRVGMRNGAKFCCLVRILHAFWNSSFDVNHWFVQHVFCWSSWFPLLSSPYSPIRARERGQYKSRFSQNHSHHRANKQLPHQRMWHGLIRCFE